MKPARAIADAPDTPVVLRLAPGPGRRRWQDAALCAQVDLDLFFPEKGGSTRPAKRVCRACEVRIECLEYAVEHEDITAAGIWGGMSERERRVIKRQLRAEAS